MISILSSIYKVYVCTISLLSDLINSFLNFADLIAAFGYSCSSMDALSKTFYFKKTSHRGTVDLHLWNCFTCFLENF